MSVSVDSPDAVRQREVEELERLLRVTTPSHEAPPHTEATLTLTRDADDDVQDRTVKLWVDDELLGEIRYGEIVTRPVAAGHHRLKAHNTLISTKYEFDARPGEHVHIRVSNAMTNSGMFLMLLIGWAMLRVRVERVA